MKVEGNGGRKGNERERKKRNLKSDEWTLNPIQIQYTRNLIKVSEPVKRKSTEEKKWSLGSRENSTALKK